MKINLDDADQEDNLNSFEVYFNSEDSCRIAVNHNIFYNDVLVFNGDNALSVHIKDFTKFAKAVTMMEAKLKEIGKIE